MKFEPHYPLGGLQRIVLTLCLAALSGCAESAPPSKDDGSLNAATGSGSGLNNSPTANRRWRLGPSSELERVVLPLSHILVRHSEAEPEQAPLVLPDWKVLAPPPSRSRDDAGRLAQTLRNQLSERPADFAKLARTHSEDTTTREFDGHLGGVILANLTMWPDVLDVLAATPEGGISQVAESPWGFHILLKLPVARVQQVGARRIVIGYQQSEWLRFNGRLDSHGDWTRRTRSEALFQANQLQATLYRDPSRFDELVKAHSDHWDAEQGGDYGVWSSLEANAHSRAMTQLMDLKVGQNTRPIDSFLGWVIWQRTDNTERPAFAVESLRFRYDDTRPSSDEDSKAAAKLRAEAALRLVSQSDDEFNRLTMEFGEGVQYFTAGRGRRGVQPLLETTRVGALAGELVDADGAFLILRRLDPLNVEPPLEPLTVLELPTRVSLEYHLARLSAEGRLKVLADAGLRSGVFQRFSKAEYARFEQITQRLSKEVATAVQTDSAVRSVVLYLTVLRQRWGVAAYERFVSELADDLEARVLR